MATLKSQLKNRISCGVLILCSLFYFGFYSMTQDFQKIQKEKFIVLGNCAMCQERIESIALNLSGVKYASWNVELKILNVIFNQGKTNLQVIQKAIANSGHDTPLVKARDSVYQALPLCCLYQRVDISIHQMPLKK